MKIYRPIQSNYKTQDFGENKACAVIGVRPFKVVTKVSGVCPPGTEEFYPRS